MKNNVQKRAPKKPQIKPRFVKFGQLKNISKPFKIFIRATFNNVFFTAIDATSAVIGTFSMGYTGFNGSARMTQHALTEAGKKFGAKLVARLRSMKSKSRFILTFRTAATPKILSAVQGMKRAGVPFTYAVYRPSLAHNGMRGRKLRRV
jgi:ribosomal protein S11